MRDGFSLGVAPKHGVAQNVVSLVQEGHHRHKQARAAARAHFCTVVFRDFENVTIANGSAETYAQNRIKKSYALNPN